jgi:phosphopantetheine--protein transferase-like protein
MTPLAPLIKSVDVWLKPTEIWPNTFAALGVVPFYANRNEIDDFLRSPDCPNFLKEELTTRFGGSVTSVDLNRLVSFCRTRLYAHQILAEFMNCDQETFRIDGTPPKLKELAPSRYPRFHISISHSGFVSAVAWSTDGVVGIDVEAVDPEKSKTIKKVLSATESNLDLVGDDQLFQIWCAKEATAKALGVGIGMDLKRIQIDHTKTTVDKDQFDLWKNTWNYGGKKYAAACVNKINTISQ